MSVYYHETDFIPSTFFYYYISKDRKLNIVATKQKFSPYCVKQMEKNHTIRQITIYWTINNN